VSSANERQFIPARALSINGIVIATVNARDVSLSTGNSTTDPARTANQIVGTGGITNPRGDGSSNIRTVFFEILGACIGVATLIVAILALRAMPKKHLHDSESPPVTENGNSPPVGTELEQLPSHGASTSDQEPGMVQQTVDTQSQETESSE
jgi:PPE-repeat protein